MSVKTTTRDLDLETLTLEVGKHEADHTFCVMEAVAYVAGERWSDHPGCASPVLTSFAMGLNDRLPTEQRQLLKPFVLRLVDTKASREVEQKRAFMAADWACRVALLMALRTAGLESEAKTMEALEPITTESAARSAASAARSAESAKKKLIASLDKWFMERITTLEEIK